MQIHENKYSLKNDVFEYAHSKYGTEPEYLWENDPESAVLRHRENKKWYALIMNVPRKKLGLDEDGKTYILNLKTGSIMSGSLINQEGIFPGYHQNKANWISVLLDGSVDKDTIFPLIDLSFSITDKKSRNTVRGTKNWLIPANPKFYDIEAEVNETPDKIFEWKQTCSILPGDIVYMYLAAPVSALKYKFSVTETDIPYNYSDKNLEIRKIMRLKLLAVYDKTPITLDKMKTHGVYAVRGARSIPQSLIDEIKILYGE